MIIERMKSAAASIAILIALSIKSRGAAINFKLWMHANCAIILLRHLGEDAQVAPLAPLIKTAH